MSVEKANRTWHAGKPKKKPDYDREEITEELLAAVVGVYEALDEYGNHHLSRQSWMNLIVG